MRFLAPVRFGFSPMSKPQLFSLDSVRTDGWFERIGQGIGSFRALCDIVGERFFAFSMITGARITALTVDRRNPDDTQVDFVVGAEGDEDAADTQRLPLPDFRRRLVAALLNEGPMAPPPTRDTDVEAIQLHIGVRFLLLAPLFGYSLQRLEVTETSSILHVLVDGRDTTLELRAFQARMRTHVREELERASAPQRSTIDLANVALAESATADRDWKRVTQLLGSWPAPLSIFLRTPEGQSLAVETAALIAKGLGMLATACVNLGDMDRGEEIFRLGVQYAQDGPAASDIFIRFGEAVLADGRPGEAIGLLRRAAALGASNKIVQPALARAYIQRHRFVAAHACIQSALDAGVLRDQLDDSIKAVEQALGPALAAWKTRASTPPPSRDAKR